MEVCFNYFRSDKIEGSIQTNLEIFTEIIATNYAFVHFIGKEVVIASKYMRSSIFEVCK